MPLNTPGVGGGGALSVVEFTFNHDDLVTLAPSGAVGADIHIDADLWIWAVGIAVTVAFDDSEAAAGDPPTVENLANDVEYAFAGTTGGLTVTLTDGHTTPGIIDTPGSGKPMLTGPSGADFIMNCGNAFLAGDGTEGTIVVTFLVSDA